MPTHRSKKIPALIARLKAIAFADTHSQNEYALTVAEIRMLVDELELNAGLAKAAIMARLGSRPDTESQR